jgi:hypothetical protein
VQFSSAIVVIYVAGALVALWRTDAAPLPRIGLALLWPLALLACATTLAMLAAAAMVLFPLVGVLVMGAAGTLWWLLR